MNEIIIKLNRLADMQSQKDLIELHYGELRSKAIPDEVKQILAEIDAEAYIAIEGANAGIIQLQDEIKKAVLELGESVKGKYVQAVWNKGRISWDTKALDGYAAAHPEIGIFRKEGNPSVTLRTA